MEARRQRGIAYMALMVAVAVLGLTATYSVRVGAAFSRHDAEEELLHVGMLVQRALHSYANASPPGAPRAPLSLDELLRDARYPGKVRHLRRIPVDPMTGHDDWILVRTIDGRIAAIHSRSKEKPLKRTGFEPALSYLDECEATSYQQWVFFGPRDALCLPCRPCH